MSEGKTGDKDTIDLHAMKYSVDVLLNVSNRITALVHSAIEPGGTEYHFLLNRQAINKLECVSLSDTLAMLGCNTTQSPTIAYISRFFWS